MYNFDFMTEEHRMIQEAARDFAQREIVPIAEHHDATANTRLKRCARWGSLALWELRCRRSIAVLRWTHWPMFS